MLDDDDDDDDVVVGRPKKDRNTLVGPLGVSSEGDPSEGVSSEGDPSEGDPSEGVSLIQARIRNTINCNKFTAAPSSSAQSRI